MTSSSGVPGTPRYYWQVPHQGENARSRRKRDLHSRVHKVERFAGRLSRRSLYVYLPPGYYTSDARYPVLYMHDGQNCFSVFEHDAFAGSWRADLAADKVIGARRAQACIIVAVSHGGRNRIKEYLPPEYTYSPKPTSRRDGTPRKPRAIRGAADVTYAYYAEDVAPFVHEKYRTLTGRENAATCGSSMGGLFSAYLAFEKPDFARHHAIMSPALWITREGGDRPSMIERIRTLPKRDVRLWLDSGEGRRRGPGDDDDNKHDTLLAKQALKAAGYVDGRDFRYQLVKGAMHSEADWAKRFADVLAFLFPASGHSQLRD